MKRLIGLFLGILLSISSPAQDTVTIPDSIAAKVIDELIIKDGMVIELHKKDSMLTVFANRIINKDNIIYEYKLKEDQYKLITSNNEEIKRVLLKERTDLKKQLRKEKLKKAFTKVLVIAEAIIIVILVI